MPLLDMILVKLLKIIPSSQNLYKILFFYKPKFKCPICNYNGPFHDMRYRGHSMKDEMCPKCFLKGRHRLQFLVMERMSERFDLSDMSFLHIAPQGLTDQILAS